MSDRGSGRTARQLAALPDGGIYLVHNGKMAAYCRALLCHLGRRHNALILLTPANVWSECRGGRLETAWDIDHAFDRLAGEEGRRAAAELRAFFPRG